MCRSTTCPSAFWIGPYGMLLSSPSQIGRTPICPYALNAWSGITAQAFFYRSATHKPRNPGHHHSVSSGRPNVTMRKFIGFLLLTNLVWSHATVAQAPAALLATFSSEQQAQHHCPADTVVWLNLPSGIYHFRGERWYG